MAQEDLKKTIRGKVQKEKEEILVQANREVGQIIQQAKDEALSLRESYLSEIKKTCLIKKTRELSQINLETQKMLLEAKEKKISEVFAHVDNNFKAICQDKNRYKPIFKELFQEAKESLGKDRVKLKVNPQDKELASEVAKELKLSTRLETDASVDGGLELCDWDENMIILNTFKSRLNKLLPELRQEASKILFGN